MPTPWYSYPILDFITEVLWPFTIEDHHEFAFTLTKRPDPKPWEEVEGEVKKDREAVLERAEELRRETQESDEPEESKDGGGSDAGPLSELGIPGVRTGPAGWLDQ